MKKWKYVDKGSTIEEFFLKNMGVASLDEVNAMFKKSYDDKYVISDMDKAINLIKKHKDDVITIFGDYDADGITSTSILILGLRRAGYKVQYLIPKRHTEGFGCNKGMVDKAISWGTKLIITCDNGIAQLETIDYAKKRGLDVLITDHHELSVAGLPNADVIIDPSAIPGQCEFSGYCGAGIAYKVIRALFKCEEISDSVTLNKCLSLCAIGTVADVMELKEENYVFVKNGMKKIQNPITCPLGLHALACEFGLQHHMCAKDIGFKLGPVINAQSRLIDDGASEVVEFFINETRPYNEVINIIEKFKQRNDARKNLKRDNLKAANAYIADNCLFGNIPLIIRLDTCPEGIIGIIAGNLTEKYGVPTLVLCETKDDKNVLKGSGRSVDGYDIISALKKVDGLSIESSDDNDSVFTKYGGHESACGFSVRKDKFDEFVSLMTSSIPENFEPVSTQEIEYNFEILSKNIEKNVKELEKFEPWGMGNPMPVFKIRDFKVIPKDGVWKKVMAETIIKLKGANASAIGFDMAEHFSKIEPRTLNLVGELSLNYFNGDVDNQIEFMDFEEVSSAKMETPLAKKLKSMALIS